MSGAPQGWLAVSLGEPGGIGAELALRAWSERTLHSLPPFAVVGDQQVLRARAHALGTALPTAVPLEPLEPTATAETFADTFTRALPVISVPLGAEAVAGRVRAETAHGVIASLERALSLVRSGTARGLVTLPIMKHVLLDAGFGYPGHTDWLGARAGARPLMLFVSGTFRVAPLTTHIPLRDVADALSVESIVEAGSLLAHSLAQDFGVKSPARLAVAALNPHAGEHGALGREELEVIEPAVRILQERGIAASGPIPADSLFHEESRARFDAVLAMYHDQALIPFKQLDFWGGAQASLGLPFVRTSPDHGPALDIATSGGARIESFIAALHLADEMVRARARGTPS